MHAPAPDAALVDGVHLTVADGLARIRLQRPPGNRVDIAMLARLRTIAESLAADASLRAVWLSADGPDFCHGIDLRDPALARRLASGPAALEAIAALGQATIDAYAALPVPTIASARGRIIGAGACLFVASDLRVAAPDAALCFPEVDRGMSLGFGILPRMVRALGTSTTTRLALTGAPCPVAQLPPGALTLADAPDEAALALALAMTARPPLAVRAIVRSLRALAAGRDPSADDPAQLAATLASADFTAAMRAWLSGQPAVYTGA
ncbi:MAG: enoyl-CoA hydratase/isomerase family protein [Myxococcota bacterium]